MTSLTDTTPAHVIDLDTEPELRPWMEGWSVIEHKKGGTIIWDAEKLDIFRSTKQQSGADIGWEELRKELETQPVLNANVLEYLLENRELIPEAWKELDVPFWGTIFRNEDDNLCVRSIWWNDCAYDGLTDEECAEYPHLGWTDGRHEFDDPFMKITPAAIYRP